MSHLTHVVTGEPFKPAAGDWNAFVDTARTVRDQRVIFKPGDLLLSTAEDGPCKCCDGTNCIPLSDDLVTTCDQCTGGAARSYLFDPGTVDEFPQLGGEWYLYWSGSGLWPDDATADDNPCAWWSENIAVTARAWSASTYYIKGDYVTNDSGKTYTLINTSGTSATSGGPTGTGSAITDGTATWDYVSTNVGTYRWGRATNGIQLHYVRGIDVCNVTGAGDSGNRNRSWLWVPISPTNCMCESTYKLSTAETLFDNSGVNFTVCLEPQVTRTDCECDSPCWSTTLPSIEYIYATAAVDYTIGSHSTTLTQITSPCGAAATTIPATGKQEQQFLALGGLGFGGSSPPAFDALSGPRFLLHTYPYTSGGGWPHFFAAYTKTSGDCSSMTLTFVSAYVWDGDHYWSDTATNYPSTITITATSCGTTTTSTTSTSTTSTSTTTGTTSTTTGSTTTASTTTASTTTASTTTGSTTTASTTTGSTTTASTTTASTTTVACTGTCVYYGWATGTGSPTGYYWYFAGGTCSSGCGCVDSGDFERATAVGRWPASDEDTAAIPCKPT